MSIYIYIYIYIYFHIYIFAVMQYLHAEKPVLRTGRVAMEIFKLKAQVRPGMATEYCEVTVYTYCYN